MDNKKKEKKTVWFVCVEWRIKNKRNGKVQDGEIYVSDDKGRKNTKLRFKCMNSDREGMITKKSGLQKKREENVQADERFVLGKRYNIRFVFSNSIALLSFIYICTTTSQTKLDWIPYYSICHCFHVTIFQFIHSMTNKTTSFYSSLPRNKLY